MQRSLVTYVIFAVMILSLLYMSGFPGAALPELGQAELLPKPFTRKELAGALDRMLRKSRKQT